jgi:hypothetical protein
MMLVDELAQEIRRVDGNHDLGAGALAEALMPWIQSLVEDRAERAYNSGWEQSNMARRRSGW